jgi:hypothetical protein
MAEGQGRDRLQSPVYPDQLYYPAGTNSGEIAPKHRYAGIVPGNGDTHAFFPGPGMVHPETDIYKEQIKQYNWHY